MRKYLVLLLPLLMVFTLTNGAFCAEGDEFSTTSFRVDSSGQVVYKALVEAATTNDTVTAAESGKTFFVSTITQAHFTLPTATAGLTYTFTTTNGHGTSGLGRIYLIPSSADTFVGCVSSSTTTTFAAGDSLYSPEATGDSVTITAPAAGSWVCEDRIGTWVDGNSLP